MITKFRFLLFILLFSGMASLFSQTQGVLGKRFFDNWSVGIGAGPNIFFGDLKAYNFLPATSNMNEVKFGGTFTLTRQLRHVFAIRGQFLYSEISGTKRYHYDGTTCNEYFDGNILEGNLNTTINFSNLLAKRYYPNRKFFLYGTIGLGTSSWNAKVKDLTNGIPIRRNDSLGGWTTSLMGLVGVGFWVNLGDKVNLGLEWNLHAVNSDQVDATVGKFKYDAYSMLSLNLTYNFNKRNPGKDPDQYKPIVPVYVPPVKDTTSVTPPPVVTPVQDTTLTDTIPGTMDFPADQDSAANFAGQSQTGLIFRVQLFALKTDKYTAAEVREKYSLNEEVYKDFSDDWYRYTTGAFTNYADAKVMKDKMRKRGFKGAFIARYNNGVRVGTHGKK